MVLTRSNRCLEKSTGNSPKIVCVHTIGDFHTEISCEDFRIIYPIHEPKAVMESVYQNGIWFVKNERKVHFGFSMNPQKIHELNAKESIPNFQRIKISEKNV